MITVALVGNPNCGKTALFNALTGSRQRVGNWPGVTVERKLGHASHRGASIQVVDLPGIYSTSVTSEAALDEKISCDYLLANEADIIVNVLDGSNLMRNLYLSLQLIEKRLPVILAVNMMDIVHKRGLKINLKRLAKLTGCKVVAIVANKAQGLDELKEAMLELAQRPKVSPLQLTLADKIQQSINTVAATLNVPHATWLAQRLLESDHYAQMQVDHAAQALAQAQIKEIEATLGEEPDILIADARYVMANEISDSVTDLSTARSVHATEIIDRVVLNRFLGIPIFLGIMYLMFLFAINVGGAFQDFFNIGSSTIFIGGLAHVLQQWSCPSWLIAILANGLGKGINTVVTFAPVIGAMFLFLAFLEDCGYMARAAFVMDRFMRALGLPGKSFVPMIVGFGCNVPAVMGARTLSNPRDRILTIMMMPFMSCGARLAIFSVFASAFFPTGGAAIIFALYVLGILVAVLSGLVLRKTLLKGKSESLVMELPPYHVPHLGALLRHAWVRLKGFLFRAGKYIIPICLLIGVLSSISMSGHLIKNSEGDKHSLLSQIGRSVTPVFAPMGVRQDNWPATVGLATGILAKEVVVGTLNALYGQEANSAEEKISFDFWGGLKEAALSVPRNLSGIAGALKNPVVANESPHDMSKSAYRVMYTRFDAGAGAFAYLLFVLLYFPCVSTMAAIRREVNKRWAYFSVCWSTGLAYALAVICYQALTILRHPVSSTLWLGGMLAGLVAAAWGLRTYAQRGPVLMPRASQTQEVV